MDVARVFQEKRRDPVFSICCKPLILVIIVLSFSAGVSCKPSAEEIWAEARYLSEARHWDKKVLSDLENAEANLTTSWRKGRLYYTLDVTPRNGDFERYIKDTLAENKFAIHFEDMAGLNLLTIDVPLKKMASTGDGKGKPAALETDGNIRCSKQMYKAITEWTLTWYFPQSR
jgi:hypothetical protein